MSDKNACDLCPNHRNKYEALLRYFLSIPKEGSDLLQQRRLEEELAAPSDCTECGPLLAEFLDELAFNLRNLNEHALCSLHENFRLRFVLEMQLREQEPDFWPTLDEISTCPECEVIYDILVEQDQPQSTN